MAANVLQLTGQQLCEDWPGQTSQKFRTNKAHIPQPEYKETKHPLFQAEQRKHFESRLSAEHSWKPSIRLDQIGVSTKVSQCKDEWVNKVKPERVFTEARHRAQRKHLQARPSEQLDEEPIGLKTFIDIHNRKSVNEFSQEAKMGLKKRVHTIYDQRNGMPLQSLGDKIYKAPEYQPGFFKEGGLIPGSTHQKKIKSGGNSKVIDFYAGIQLGKGPLNPNRKLWKDAVKEQLLNEELEAVGPGLKKWERHILKEVDPKYQVSDDSEDEKKKK